MWMSDPPVALKPATAIMEGPRSTAALPTTLVTASATAPAPGETRSVPPLTSQLPEFVSPDLYRPPDLFGPAEPDTAGDSGSIEDLSDPNVGFPVEMWTSKSNSPARQNINDVSKGSMDVYDLEKGSTMLSTNARMTSQGGIASSHRTTPASNKPTMGVVNSGFTHLVPSPVFFLFFLFFIIAIYD